MSLSLKYKNPPLPFYGNKSNFKEIISQICVDYNGHDDMIFVDLFGGSLYLSYLFKSFFPNCQVISNDYDDYHIRLQNYYYTNDLLKLITLVVNFNTSNLNKKMSPEDERTIRLTLDRYVHYKDWITLGSKLCFSGAFISSKDDFYKNSYYYKKIGSIPNPTDYLSGLTIVKKDWEELFNEYKDNPNAIFIFDPPYDNTNNSTYRNKIIDLDNLITCCLSKEHFFFFTHNHSNCIDIFQKRNDLKSFSCHRSSINCKCAKKDKYDILFYK